MQTTQPSTPATFNEVFAVVAKPEPPKQIDLGRAFEQLKARLLAMGVICLLVAFVSCKPAHIYQGGPCKANENMTGYNAK